MLGGAHFSIEKGSPHHDILIYRISLQVQRHRTDLDMLTALVVRVDAVGDALAGDAVVGLLAVAGHRVAQGHHDARVVPQLVQRLVEGRVLARLDQKLIHHCPQHRAWACMCDISAQYSQVGARSD